MSETASGPSISTTGARLEEVPNVVVPSAELTTLSVAGTVERTDASRGTTVVAEHESQSQSTTSAPQDPECRRSFQLRLNDARHTSVTPALSRKRANSLDASSSRISGGKRMRPLDTAMQQQQIELPEFVVEATAREIIVVPDDDETETDDDGTWFDYVGPTPASKGSGDGTQPKDSDRSSGRLRDKKGGRPNTGSGAGDKVVVKPKTRSRGSRAGANKPGQGRGGRRGERDHNGDSDKIHGSQKPPKRKPKRKPKVTESSDEEDEVEVGLSGPWQGPINLEPFDGGLGLSDDESPENEEAQRREARLFPGPMRPTDQFWQRRVRVCEQWFQSCWTDASRRAQSSHSSRIAPIPYRWSLLAKLPSRT